MDKSQDKLLLKKVLTRYDQLGVIRKRIAEGEETLTSLEKLRKQSRKKINEIHRDFKEQDISGPLATLLSKYRLNKYQTVIILALLRQRLTSSCPHLTGRDLLQLIFDDSFGILKGMSYIDVSSLLVSTGIIVPESSSEEEDILDFNFKLSDRVFSMVYKTFSTSSGRDFSQSKTRGNPYPNNLTHVMDYRKLSLLYQKRATKVFNYDYWDEIGLGVAESVQGINQQITQMREHMQARLDKTKLKNKLHLLNFINSSSLSEDEVIVLITLLFQEVMEGNAFLNAVDLLRLISRNEKDLLRKRRFFARTNTLLKHRLIQLEEMVNGKELTADVSLPNNIVELILTGSMDRSSAIDIDARLDFHNYLKNIDSSEDFLDDLDS